MARSCNLSLVIWFACTGCNWCKSLGLTKKQSELYLHCRSSTTPSTCSSPRGASPSWRPRRRPRRPTGTRPTPSPSPSTASRSRATRLDRFALASGNLNLFKCSTRQFNSVPHDDRSIHAVLGRVLLAQSAQTEALCRRIELPSPGKHSCLSSTQHGRKYRN